ncbi:MAG: hypothetical protein AAGC57_17115 [Pseudomonadota bacterium]
MCLDLGAPRRNLPAMLRHLLALACVTPMFVGPAVGYDYRTLHLIEDRRTHAIVRVSGLPGDGDPPQRGRADCNGIDALARRERNIALAFGTMFQRSGIHIDKILTSRICRQIQAARMLAIGPVTELDVLDPADPAESVDRVDRLLSYLDGLRPGETALLLAHQATIEALTGEQLGLGEGLVFTLPPFGAPRVRGRFGLPPH